MSKSWIRIEIDYNLAKTQINVIRHMLDAYEEKVEKAHKAQHGKLHKLTSDSKAPH